MADNNEVVVVPILHPKRRRSTTASTVERSRSETRTRRQTSRHTAGYDEAADGVVTSARIERVVDD